jgi:hypothetical protein
MNKDKIYKLSLVVLIIALILLVWDGCSKNAQLSAFKENVKKLNYESELFKETITKNNNRIAEQKQIIMSKRDAIDNNLLAMNDFKSVESQTKIITHISRDSIFVPYAVTDTIEVNVLNDRKFAFTDKYFGIFGSSKSNGILFDSVYFNNGLSLTIGNKSKGFFKRSEPIVQVIYDNPYSSTNSMQNIIIKNELKWYDRKRNWFGMGIGIGAFLTTLILIN